MLPVLTILLVILVMMGSIYQEMTVYNVITPNVLLARLLMIIVKLPVSQTVKLVQKTMFVTLVKLVNI